VFLPTEGRVVPTESLRFQSRSAKIKDSLFWFAPLFWSQWKVGLQLLSKTLSAAELRMKIHSLSLIKNEVDIIAQSLRAAAEWVRQYFRPGQWQHGRDVGARPRAGSGYSPTYSCTVRSEVLPWCDAFGASEPIPCKRQRRGLVVHSRCRWNIHRWSKEFLSAIPDEFQAVETQEFAYLFTDRDLEAFRQDPSLFDDESPIERRLRFYASPDWSEARFARHSENVGEIGFHQLLFDIVL